MSPAHLTACYVELDCDDLPVVVDLKGDKMLEAPCAAPQVRRPAPTLIVHLMADSAIVLQAATSASRCARDLESDLRLRPADPDFRKRVANC
jgi:hypothetical protein